MKKTLTLAAALVASAAFAQVQVTMKVDMASYVSSGGTVDAAGIHIAGDFAGNNVVTLDLNGVALPSWNPAATNSSATNLGGDLWQFVLVFNTVDAGKEIPWKFANGAGWTIAEGQSGSTTMDTTCGYDDGFGGFNRKLVIPSQNAAFRFCWSSCLQCDGSSPALSSDELEVADLTVAPNPTNGDVNVTFSARAAGTATINVMSLLGQSVMVLNPAVEAGANSIKADLNVANGTYFVEVVVDGMKSVKRVVVSH